MHQTDKKHDTPYNVAKRNSKHAILKLLLENGVKTQETEEIVQP